jgi:Putative prokaryotic signal transducing protein
MHDAREIDERQCLAANAWDDTAMSEDLVRVLSTTSLPEGEVVKARLEDEGIPVLVTGEGGGPYRMGPVHLFVPAEFEVQARLVLSQSFDDVELEEPLENGSDAGSEPD